ncbi:hypothetical protein WH47_02775 [Habropoda laboriosa]|uniref:Uncharacterized protein n=1 Tax=Habropoda laboriosa TaxID=597456 RepID=A0A0L7QXI0_9HYME|nr:PREDICTED: ankyrin repeat and ELMO domain-containing protein D-like [Habropoda laboriosa]KOC63266.1 hypothetical protein WH47_02775 [Habropoda laboriosa]
MGVLSIRKATIEEGLCHDDTDCSKLQYCYHVSKRCVDYTHCKRYNRLENDKGSRHPSQCGPCLTGYTAEKLGTGEMDYLCKKTSAQENIEEKLNNHTIIYIIIIGSVLFLCLAVVGIIFVLHKKRTSQQQEDDLEQCGKLCTVEPTAPPMENRPFICCEKGLPSIPLNNNKNLKDKNTLVRAAVCADPSWIRRNPNYENDLNNDNVNAMNDQSHSMAELAESVDNEPNNWNPEELTLQVPNRNLVTYEVEQADNSLNTALIQTNNPSLSNVTEEDDNSNNTNNDSTPESSNTQSSGERVRAPNIFISQKISMNVNLLDSDLK